MSAYTVLRSDGPVLAHPRMALVSWHDSAPLSCSIPSAPTPSQNICTHQQLQRTLSSARNAIALPFNRMGRSTFIPCIGSEGRAHGIMYDHQSQAPSTHHARFHARLKKALRLNRDPVLFLPDVTIYQESRGRVFLVTACYVKRCCCPGVSTIQLDRSGKSKFSLFGSSNLKLRDVCGMNGCS
jgi:hypothetical protein